MGNQLAQGARSYGIEILLPSIQVSPICRSTHWSTNQLLRTDKTMVVHSRQLNSLWHKFTSSKQDATNDHIVSRSTGIDSAILEIPWIFCLLPWRIQPEFLTGPFEVIKMDSTMFANPEERAWGRTSEHDVRLFDDETHIIDESWPC